METFPPAPVFPTTMGTGTIIQHFISSLRWVRYSLSVDDNVWLASSHYPMGMRKCANTLETWPCVCHAGINHLSPQRAVSTAQWTIQGNRALAVLCNSTLLFPEPSRRKQKVNPRQPKTHEITQLPITKHNSRTCPAQQVSQVFLARYLSFQQRCCSFFQKCCLLKQTGQIVVEMLRECQSAKCQKDFD